MDCGRLRQVPIGRFLCTINRRASQEDIAKTVAALGQSAQKAMQNLDKLSG
jgi:hypothetical protein